MSRGLRGSLLVGSQVASSAGSFLYLVIAAHGMGIEQYGMFGVVLAIYFVLAGVLRSLTSDLYIPRSRSGSEPMTRSLGRKIQGTVLCLVLVSGLLATLVSVLFYRASLADALLIFLGTVTLLLYQAARSILLSVERVAAVFAIEMTWAAAAVLIALGLIAAHQTSASVWFVGYGLSALASCVLAQTRFLLRGATLRPNIGYLVGSWRTTRFYLADFMIGTGAVQISFAGIALILPLDDVGILRIIQSELGPQNFLIASMSLIGIVFFSGSVRSDPRRGRRQLLAVAGISCGLLICYSIVLAMLPDSWLQVLFGSFATNAGIVYWAMVVGGSATVFLSSLVVFLRIQELGSKLLFARLVTLPTLSFPFLGAAFWGLEGAAGGLSLFSVAMLLSYLIQVFRT